MFTTLATETTLVDLDTVKAAAAKLVKSDPLRTNNGECVYARLDGTPNCIAAVLVDQLTPVDVRRTPNVPVHMSSEIRKHFTDDAVDFLDVLQAHADNRWGLDIGGCADGGPTSGHIYWADALEGALATNDPLSVRS